jgi:hypothetical protein
MSDVNSKIPRGVDLPMPVGSDEAKMFAGPDLLSDREAWRSQLHSWKTESSERLSYDGSFYEKMQDKTYGSFNVALVWLWDEILFDFNAQEFTPEKLLKDCEKFGGLDGIILWHAYPVIGIDSRNQFDFYNQVEGLDKLITSIQSFGVKVYLNYNPWDRWTERPAHSDQEELADLVRVFNFDGVFLDTMKSADPKFMEPILKVKPDVIVAGESRVQQERICDHAMSWAQWFGDSDIPGVIRAKWFEPRHMLHQTRRWNRSHIEELHIAWLNGAGMLLWEVVFGSWVGWNSKERQMWKEMVEILRAHNNLITGGSWEPLTQLNEQAEKHRLYASKFAKDDSFLITIINKGEIDYEGELAYGVSGRVPTKGVAAILKDTSGIRVLDFTYQFLDSDFKDLKPSRISQLTGVEETITISFRNRECGLYDGAPFVDAWKPLPPNFHQIFELEKKVRIRKGALSLSEVTNKEFHDFVLASGYRPKSSTRYLQHWQNGAPRPEDRDKPVAFVDIDDANAYANWTGSTIPTEWEWQFHFQSNENSAPKLWNLTDSIHTDGRTRFLILKGGSSWSIRNGQGQKSTSGIAESDWYVDGGAKDLSWVEKLLLMGKGMSRSENIGFRCFTPEESE